MSGSPALTLLELNRQIEASIKASFTSSFWVMAEISDIKEYPKCAYIDLVEKQDGGIVAQMKGVVFMPAYGKLRSEFERVTGERLRAGMNVLVSARVSFHERYGLQLRINTIDAKYTLGDMERKKREVKDRLVKEGLIDLNKRVVFPLVPQRVAILSSAKAAGYEDLIHHLDHNPHGYIFACTLFDTQVQGDEAEYFLVTALRIVRSYAHLFDVVVIVRGGGSAVDLSCFDGYALTAEIARFPLPIVTGIGHERDETLADMVAHTRAKTPTAVAELLLMHVKAYDDRLTAARCGLEIGVSGILRDRQSEVESAVTRCSAVVSRAVPREEERLGSIVREFDQATQRCFNNSQQELDMLASELRLLPVQRLETARQCVGALQRDLTTHTRYSLERQSTHLAHQEKIVQCHDPENVLRRGYSITSAAGRLVKDVSALADGSLIETRVLKGVITSIVDTVQADYGEQVGDLPGESERVREHCEGYRVRGLRRRRTGRIRG